MEKIKVSIIIVSYNSEKTIVETLRSVEEQRYKNFEIIICDDSSSDNTLEICNNWKKNIKDKIKDIEILNSKTNEGVVKNINKGLQRAKGSWIKIIAADDILKEECLVKNIEYVTKNKNVNICFSKAEKFGDFKKANEYLPENIKFFKLSSIEQYIKLKEECFIPAPTSFIKKEIFEKYGYFDEKIPMIEDYPYWLKLTSLGEKLYYFDDITVKYRIGDTLSNNITKLVNYNFLESKLLIYKYYLKNKTNIFFKYHYLFEYYSQKYIAKLFNNKRNRVSNFVFKYIKILDFYFLYLKLKKQLKVER